MSYLIFFGPQSLIYVRKKNNMERKNVIKLPFKVGFLTFELVLGVVLVIDSSIRIKKFVTRDE